MNENPGHLTEFVDGFNGTCGETAEADAEAAASDTTANEQTIVAITREMQTHQAAGPNGATTLWALARRAERAGFVVSTEWDYAEPFPHDWHNLLLQYAGVKPIILQLANGQALRDAQTGAADERGLKYHFIVILGKSAAGYVCNDGDNPQATGRYAIYSYQTLMNAQPCGLMVLEPNAKEIIMAIAGLGAGFQQYVDTNHISAKCIMTDRQLDNGQIVAAFDNGLVLMWDGHSVSASSAGEVVSYLVGQVASLKGEVETLQKRPTTNVPPELQGILANLSNVLAPTAHSFADVVSLQKKLGY